MSLRSRIRMWLMLDDAVEVRGCIACEVYRTEIDRMHRYNERLLEALTRAPEVPVEQPYVAPVEAQPKTVPWRVRKSILEAEDAQLAAAMRANKIKPLTEQGLEAEIERMKNAQGT